MASVASATSRTDLAIAPGVSRDAATRQQPSAVMRPRVGFKANRACLEAGCTMDPSFSVPIPTSEKPAETLTALPVDEPPGL